MTRSSLLPGHARGNLHLQSEILAFIGRDRAGRDGGKELVNFLDQDGDGFS